ncbi:MAG: alpha/beta hydrolase [bacterium]
MSSDSLATGSGHQQIKTGKARTSEVLDNVVALLADYFGVPTDHITPQTDLQRDLAADPRDLAELLAMICEQHGVPVLEREDITVVAQIVQYVEGMRRRLTPDGAATGSPTSHDPAPIHLQTVFYTTSRAMDDPGSPDHFYGGERATTGRGLHYGVCEVSIPVAVHQLGELESPRFFKLEFKPDPRKHVVLQSVTPLERGSFWSMLNAGPNSAVANDADDTANDVLVFIHGYNMSFAKAARRTAQMSYDLQFTGAPILFSWPSDGSLLQYVSDREDAEWSVAYLEQFLAELRRQLPAGRLHLMAHSMGNQVLIKALFRMALRQDATQPLFDNVILAAPDFDAQVFTEQIAPAVAGLANRWTLYASDKDVALEASRLLSARRLGTPLSLADGIECIDATGVEVTPWSAPEFHSYYASKLRVLADLVGVLRGIGPDARGLTRATREGRIFWKLTPQ